jgi:hypothetical protein
VHIALKILELWVLSFLTLALALTVLNIVWAAIDYDLALHSLGKELCIAAFAALVEGASVAVVLLFIPSAARALLIPGIIVALIYKIAHFEDWSRYEVFLLLAFQLLIAGFGLCLVSGFFGVAFVVLGVLAAACSIIIAVGKSL